MNRELKEIKIWEPQSFEEFYEVLKRKLGKDRITREELFQRLGIDSKFDKTMLLSIIGLYREYDVYEVAKTLWERSNFREIFSFSSSL